MSHQHQNHHSDLDTLLTPEMLRHCEQLVSSFGDQNPGDLIKKVHESAHSEYSSTKRQKQQELQPRIAHARLSGDKNAFKNAKKKVDNHASSVASRSRRVFLITSFERLVRSTVEESARLAALLLRQNAAAAKRDAEYRRRIAKLTEQIKSLSAQLEKSQPAQESTWNPEDFSMETIAHSSTAASASANPSNEQREVHAFNGMDRPGLTLELEEEDQTTDNHLASYLDKVASQTPFEASGPVEASLKMDASAFHMPYICLRSVKEQLKADAPADVFDPAV